MTSNMRSLIVGGGAFLLARYLYKQPVAVAAIAGLGAIVLKEFVTE